MSEKSFVSLFFTPHKLQLLVLNGEKIVKKFATFDLPKDIIVNYKVKDVAVLASFLKEIWQQLKIEEKYVGLVVPEFSTFTKSLSLPNLELSELDEAVRWQSQDYLPLKKQEMVMDWQIIKKEENKTQILFVAIRRDILLGFVEAVEKAGLFPLVVEIPSLSLARISDGKPTGKLVIYANFGETIIIFAQEKKILNSSVLNSDDLNGILWTAENLVKHYHNVELERLEIGGLGLTQELLDSLKKLFNKPLQWIESDVKGLTKEEVQEYLIPLSLQFKDPSQPRSENTINLLPEKWSQRYEEQKTKNRIWTLLLTISFFVWGSLLAVLSTNFTLTARMNVLQKQTAGQATELPKEIKDKVQKINQNSANIIKINEITKPPQVLINAITKAKPEGINLALYQLDLDNGRIILKGEAADRPVLIQFKKNLESNKNFSKVTIPISAFEKEQNLEFEVTFSYLASSKKGTLRIKI